jgi:hypothetical protein
MWVYLVARRWFDRLDGGEQLLRIHPRRGLNPMGRYLMLQVHFSDGRPKRVTSYLDEEMMAGLLAMHWGLEMRYVSKQ